MTIAEIIKQAREDLGMTQEDLAEKLEVSRQAVSKWELGASVPSPENLALLEEVLGVSFPAPEEEAAQLSEQRPETAVKAPFWNWNWKRVVLLVFGVLIVSALLSIVMFETLRTDAHTDVPRPLEQEEFHITGYYFYDENGVSLSPDYNAGALHFTPGTRVTMVLTFPNREEAPVKYAYLYLTEDFVAPQQLWLKVPDTTQEIIPGQTFALFILDIPQTLRQHMNIVLQREDGQRFCHTVDFTAPNLGETAAPETGSGAFSLNVKEISAVEGNADHYPLEALGAPMAEVEWSTSNPSVARVANTGTVFIEGEGEAVITASWKDQTAECLVRVFPKASVVGTEGNTDLPEGETKGLMESELASPTYESRKSE